MVMPVSDHGEAVQAVPGKPLAAVVLSGGGASGAYEVGALKALFTAGERPLEPAIFTGTSIGSFNASFLVSQWDANGRAAIANLEKVWLDRMANRFGLAVASAFRLRGNPLDLLTPAAYAPDPLRPFTRMAGDFTFLFFEALRRASSFAIGTGDFFQRASSLLDVSVLLGTEPYREIIAEIDFASIRNSSRRLRVAATNYQSGELVVFENEDMTDERGPLAVLASSSIPGVLPAVMIGAEPHVDGGVVLNTPLNLAIKAGAQELHVIYLDPAVREIPTATLQSTIDSSYRQQVIGWAKVMNENIAAARRINATVRALEQLRGDPKVSGAVDIDWLAKQLQAKQLKQVIIHRYHPHDDLAGGAVGLLNFDRRHISHLIERGFRDTKQHDCDESECVLLD
ncbi:MAG TPA: patatin-like phospholipase family protein [Thermoanaerobaculia bacterium]|nr:patatin-like phospholipase family protein [Thermoanaerobaculia bacterium]